MVNKKKIITVIIVMIVIGILYVAWVVYNFPFNTVIRDEKLYDKIRHSDVSYINEYGFFPEKLPENAEDMKWFASGGAMQAKATFTLSFITDEEFFKEEVQRWQCYNVYLYDKVPDVPEAVMGDNPYRWILAEEHYTGEVRTESEMIRNYKTQSEPVVYLKMDIPDITGSECLYTCIYVVDKYCYIAYSSKSGRIVYHMNTDLLNHFGDDYLIYEEVGEYCVFPDSRLC